MTLKEVNKKENLTAKNKEELINIVKKLENELRKKTRNKTKIDELITWLKSNYYWIISMITSILLKLSSL